MKASRSGSRAPPPDTDETAILCRSADRRSKERAMHDKFSRRIEEALERMSARIARSKKRLDPAPPNRQIGRILQQNQRAAARFAMCAGHDRRPGGESPLCNLMEVKHERSARAEPRGTV